MPKSNVKTKKAPRATQAMPKDVAPSAEKSSPKEMTPQRANGATSTDGESHAKKSSPTKAQAPATATAPSAKPTRRTRASKRKEVRLSGPHVEPGPSEPDTGTPNPDLITGDEDSTADSTAPRATKPSKGELASANTTASEPAPGEEAPIPSPDAGIDEGVPPEQLQPNNRRHLSERTHQEASQAAGTKREREASTPQTREQLLALRYWTLNEYREHLRLSRRPGPGVSQYDKCPVVLWDDTVLTRQTNEREFEDRLRLLGYACPEFLASPYRIDWLVQRRLRFRMAKMIADDQWQSRFFDRHMPTPPVIIEEVIQKIQKSWQSQPIEPRIALGRVNADQLRGPAQKQPRGRRSPPRGDSLAPMSYPNQGFTRYW
ncbi:unnamed protein product [Phytophthora fragariaefolia]|uniref:Unnamed protein product n=1 Tax=Phytophthora fragariaefolia TaxID=1490495 RepID=A0A9W6Y2L0_9STRA|nr:unnamed protein product [Phytophthora fragariaefolia]